MAGRGAKISGRLIFDKSPARMPRGVHFSSRSMVVNMDDDRENLVPLNDEKDSPPPSVILSRQRGGISGLRGGSGASKLYKFVIAAIGIILVGLVLFAAFSKKFVGNTAHKLAVFSKTTRRLELYRNQKDENPAVELALANGLATSLTIHGPYENISSSGEIQTYQWRDGSGSTVANMSIYTESNSSCVSVSWLQVGSSIFQPSYNDCIALGNTHWYGGGEMYTQFWPIETSSINSTAFVSHDIQNYPSRRVFGSVLEPLFFSSSGVVVTIDDSAPVFVSLSSPRDNYGSGAHLCLQGRKDEDIYPQFHSLTNVKFSYSVCLADGPANAYRFLVNRGTIPKPSQVPNTNMMRKPIWSTGGGVPALNQANVMAFAQEIISRAPSYSVMNLDNKFVDHYGDFVFDNATFPQPSQLFSYLKANGFSVSLWESLFVNVDSDNFDFAVHRDYLVRGSNKQVNLVKWWNGVAGIIDVTSAAASNWFLTQLRNLLQLGVDSFQFHGGEVEYLPLEHVTNVSLRNPNVFSTLYAQRANLVGGRMTVTRMAYQTQAQGNIVVLMDRNFAWGLDSGLHSLVTSTLTLSVLGYPFVLSGNVGGNAGYGRGPGNMTNSELFIRWVQLAAFFPVMQFSTPPWWYTSDPSVESLSWKAVQLHGNLSQSVMEALAVNAVQTGEPIIRPLWWIAPNDEPALATNTQFLVGNDIMVLAIVEPLQTARVQAVYVPAGRWQHCNGTIFTSTGQYFVESLTLSYIPYFCRLSSSTGAGSQFCSRQSCG